MVSRFLDIRKATAATAVSLLFALASAPSAAEGAGVSLSSNKAWLWHVAKLRSDRDGDGLSFERESALGTDPNRADSDGDGVADGEEVAKGYNPLRADSDQDGLSDGREVSFGSNPLVADTDGDSVLDGEEFSLGLDPTVDDCPSWRCRGLPKWLLAVASQRSTEVSGAAAVGAALAGASVSATDANGQAIAVSATTASNGTYTLDLPKDVTFPVVLWVRAQDGTQIRTIIGDAPAKAGSTITAHVTPITEAASSTLMDDPDAPPLSEVKGSDFKATGQAIVTGLFGGSVDFEAFSEDPSFTPAAEGATAPPSVTDTMLDTVARAASQSGSGLADFVKTQSAAGAKLLQQPKFQVQLVGELTKKGNPPEQLVEKLQAAGAVAEDDPDAEMTLWAATEGVPKALSAASSKAGKDDARLMDAMIESMATLTEQRVASGGAEAAANTLKSEAVQDSVADVITDAMAVWLEVDPEDEEEAEAIAEIALRAGANAGKVVAGLSDDALASSSGKELAKASVKRSAVPQDVAAARTALESGQSTKDLTPEIEDSSEVEEIYTIIVSDDPTLMGELDTDGDGYVGDDDAFPFNPNEYQDTDGDGVGDNSDAFPRDSSEFLDTDLDGIGNNADTDDDGDRIEDSLDLFPLDGREWQDTDGDGLGDNADPDDDGDGVEDRFDAFPLDALEFLDSDGDGVGNNADEDDDGDGIEDAADAFPLDRWESRDSDGDGLGDNAQLARGPEVEGALPLDESFLASRFLLPSGDGYLVVEGDEEPGAYLMHRFEGGRVLSVLGQASGGGAWRLEDGKLYVRDSYEEYPQKNDSDPRLVLENYNAACASPTDQLSLRSENTQRFVATGETAEFVEGELSGITLSFDISPDPEWNCALDPSQPLMVQISEPRPARFLKAQALGAFTASELVGQTIAVSLGDLKEEGIVTASFQGELLGDGTGRNRDTGSVFSWGVDGAGRLLVHDGARRLYVTRLSSAYDPAFALVQTLEAGEEFATLSRLGLRSAPLARSEVTDFVTDAPLLTTINYYAVTGPLSELVRDTFGFTLYGDGTMVNFSGFDNGSGGGGAFARAGEWAYEDGALLLAFCGLSSGYAETDAGLNVGSGGACPRWWSRRWDVLELTGDRLRVRESAAYLAGPTMDFWGPEVGPGPVESASDALAAARELSWLKGEFAEEHVLAVFSRVNDYVLAPPGLNPLDLDGDGFRIFEDAFPLDASEGVDTDGDGLGNNADQDDDGDGVSDVLDEFPLDSSESVDTDGDGLGNNADQDDDGDLILDGQDEFPLDASESSDSDGDGVGDNSDAFPQDPFRFEEAPAPLLGVDQDQDGIPDVLDADPTDSLVGRDSDLDGVADLVDLYPLDSSEAFDTDGDGIGDNADLDDDGDGIPDVSDSGPLDTDNDGVPNLVDSDDDNDGVLDGEDIFPLDDSKSKSLRARIKDAVALRLADQLSQDENVQASANGWFTLPLLINRAYAADSGNEALTAQLNTTFLDASSEVLSNALRASSSTFVAEAQITPSGEALYLLTSNHIQRALFGLDPEPCSIYRVQVSDGEALCLLPSDRGDIEPRALVSSMEFDYSRRGIDFRADGAAVMQGFNWSQQLPSGVSGGTNSTIAWHLSPAGQLTPIQPDGNFFVVGVLWLNEDVFAVFEFPYIYQDDALNNFDDERISLYDGSTLEKLVSLDADNIWSRIVRHEGNLYWSYGGYLNGRTLKSESSPLIGTHPLLDQDGARLWAFEDAASGSELRSQDGSFVFKLAESGASMYNWQAQNGTGTDVKYSPFALTKNYVSFKKALAPDATLMSVNGAPVQNGDTLSVGASSSLYIRDGNQEFFVTPAADEQAFSVTLAYQKDSGEVVNYELELTQAVLDAWRADHSGPRPEGMRIEDWGIPIASPVPDRETACVVSLASGQQRCADLSNFEVLAFDQESYRSNRYYGTPVYPDNRGNAFPGIANVFIQGDQWVFYFKDSTTHQYWQGTADLETFLSQGDDALALSPAVNGAGDTSIIMAAIDLEPRAPSIEEFQAVTAEIPEGIPRIIISLPGGGFSAYGKIPAITLRRQGVVVPQSVRPFVEFRTGNLVLTPAARGSGLFCELEVELEGPLFVRKPGVAERVVSEGVISLSGSADACADDAGFEVLVELVDADGDGLTDAVDPRPFDAANQGVLSQADGETSGGESPGGDADGDGVPNGQDAFPNDPAASLDLDQDGFPDVWNAGYAQQDSTTGLVLDSRVGVGGAPVDSGDQDWSTTTVGVFDQTEFDGSVFGDGAGEIGDSDGDGVPDIYDAFPGDPAASIDRDSDGRPDRWNSGRGLEDSTTGLVLDDDGGEGFDGAPSGGTGIEPGLFDGSRFDEAVFGGIGGSPGYDRDGDGVGDPYDAFPDDERFSLDDDRDGLPDRFNPGFFANEDDVALDPDLDNDGLSNERELALGTDPYRSDSDGDGRPDGFDSAPLDGTAGDPVCVGNSCIEYDDEVIYHLALKALPSDLSEVEAPFAFEHGDRVTGAQFSGGLVGGSFLFGDPSAPQTYRTTNDDGQFLFQAEPSAWAAQQTALSSYLAGATELQLFLAPEGRVDNGFLLEGSEKLVRLNLTTFDEAATPLADIEVQNPFLTIYRPLPGSGSREGGQCVEAGDGFARYASGLSHHGQVSLFPSNAIAGGRMDLLGRGGENSLYLCSDTPEGRYDIALVALDGRGGRRDLSLTIEIAKARVYGGFLSWKNADFSLPDGDGDGIPNSLDAFPNDQRFAHDRDHDGIPDRFVEGYTPEIHEEEMLDSDDDGDGLSDEFEASYGTNAFRSDSDGDGAEDGWDGAPLDSSVWDPVCADNRCIRYPDGIYYHFALTESFESFAFEHAQAGLSAHFRGGMVGGRFEFGEGPSIAEFASADEQGTSLWESDPQRLADQEDEFARYLRQSGGSLSLRIPEGGSVDNGFEIQGAATPIYMNLVALRDGQLVSDLSSSSLKSHLRIYRPLEGTGSREDSQCREFGLDELAPELEHHGSLTIYPSSTLSGGRMDLLGRGGENSLYVCSDTPVGEFQVRLFLLDGRGGRVDLPLTVEILEGRIFEGSVRWFESSEEAASSPDTDQDGFEDNVDAFPEDPAASVDEDQDGRPEAWNRGFGEGDSTSGLQLDESPGGQPGSGGLPPGVFDSSNWDEAEFAGAQADFDGDGVVDVFDAFPQDPAASVDEDKDGFPDRWNDGKGEQDSTSGLTLDESPGGVIPVGKFNEARWGEALYG